MVPHQKPLALEIFPILTGTENPQNTDVASRFIVAGVRINLVHHPMAFHRDFPHPGMIADRP